MRRLLGLMAVLALIGHDAQASDINGVSFADGIVLHDQRLALHGLALKEATFLKVDVYAVALYLDERWRTAEIDLSKAILSADRLTAVRFHFLRDVDREKLARSWLKDLRAACETGCDAVLERAWEISASLPDIMRDERITYLILPDRFDVLVGETLIGSLVGEDAVRALRATFFGPQASKQLREDLLRPLADG